MYAAICVILHNKQYMLSALDIIRPINPLQLNANSEIVLQFFDIDHSEICKIEMLVKNACLQYFKIIGKTIHCDANIALDKFYDKIELKHYFYEKLKP